MAKRNARAEADEVTADKAPKGRAKARRELGTQTVANREPDTVKPNTITAGPETISEQLDDASRVRQAPGDVFPSAGRRATERDPSEEEIRERAYQMYLERGGSHGLDFDDWVRAEQELKQRR